MPAVQRSLHVIVAQGTGQKFSCQSCTRCCRDLVVELTDEDKARIDASDWPQTVGADPYVRMDRKWVLNKHPDGRCVFLLDDGRCRIHAEEGFDAKPLACRLFPYELIPSDRTVLAGIRFDCPSAAKSVGQSLSHDVAMLRTLAPQVAHLDRATAPVIRLNSALIAQSDELDALDRHLDRWFAETDRPLLTRLHGAVWLTQTLAKARLHEVRGPRFRELLDLLMGAVESEIEAEHVAPPIKRHTRLFRQLVYAYTGHVRFEDYQRGRFERWRMRWKQLRLARRFHHGRGRAPDVAAAHTFKRAADFSPRGLQQAENATQCGTGRALPDMIASITFNQVESIAPGTDPAIDELMTRYIRNRLAVRQAYGPGYYSWSVIDGLNALWLSIAAAGWWSRYFTASNDRDHIEIEDLHDALALVDRAAGRAPALGSNVERLRANYLLNAGCVAALLHQYIPLSAT